MEPIHIHVRKGDNRAKFWVEPMVPLAKNHGFSSRELSEIQEIIE